MTTQNPRAVIGDNLAPDFAQRVTDEMRQQYEATLNRVQELLDLAERVESVDDEAGMGEAARLAKDGRDLHALLNSLRETEKAPHFRAAQAVDGIFKPPMERLRAPNRTSKPGMVDELQKLIDDYNQRKLAAERERRRQEAEEKARIEREAREREEHERREAEERRRKAERARKPETVEAKGALADAAESAAAISQAVAEQASVAAEDARIATLAKPADLVRTRVEDGPLVTMGTEKFAVVEDASKLDKEALWPFLTLEAKEQALRGWARSTGHSVQMAGARIGRRPKTVLR